MTKKESIAQILTKGSDRTESQLNRMTAVQLEALLSGEPVNEVTETGKVLIQSERLTLTEFNSFENAKAHMEAAKNNGAVNIQDSGTLVPEQAANIKLQPIFEDAKLKTFVWESKTDNGIFVGILLAVKGQYALQTPQGIQTKNILNERIPFDERLMTNIQEKTTFDGAVKTIRNASGRERKMLYASSVS